MPRIGSTSTTRTVVQDDPALLQVQVGHDTDDPKYVELAHGVNTVVWTPASGYLIHLKGMLLSAEGKGHLVLYRDATAWARMDFNEKKTVPILGPFEVTLDADEAIKATWTADASEVGFHITLVGHEHAE